MMSDETEPPRCVWSSASPSIGVTLIPSDDGPTPPPEPPREQGEPRQQEDVERDPHADDAPVPFEREDDEGDEYRARGDHRPHQILRVARSDQDPVEREHGA